VADRSSEVKSSQVKSRLLRRGGPGIGAFAHSAAKEAKEDKKKTKEDKKKTKEATKAKEATEASAAKEAKENKKTKESIIIIPLTMPLCYLFFLLLSFFSFFVSSHTPLMLSYGLRGNVPWAVGPPTDLPLSPPSLSLTNHVTPLRRRVGAWAWCLLLGVE
jgi:hypothetical protein